VTDAADGNVTPAVVELKLLRGLFLPGRRPAAAAEGYAKGAYGRAGVLEARVSYGRGSLHNSPTEAAWSGGWWCD
jgi:hypothetical protein